MNARAEDVIRPVGSPFARFADSRGQAMLEYVIATLLCVALLIGFSASMQVAVARYLNPIFFWVGLPIP